MMDYRLVQRLGLLKDVSLEYRRDISGFWISVCSRDES